MFGLGNKGSELVKKIHDSKDFNEWEKSLLIQGLRDTEDSNNPITQTLRSQVND